MASNQSIVKAKKYPERNELLLKGNVWPLSSFSVFEMYKLSQATAICFPFLTCRNSFDNYVQLLIASY